MPLTCPLQGEENTMGEMCWWPFPKKDQQVYLCGLECMRECEEDGREVPIVLRATICCCALNPSDSDCLRWFPLLPLYSRVPLLWQLAVRYVSNSI